MTKCISIGVENIKTLIKQVDLEYLKEYFNERKNLFFDIDWDKEKSKQKEEFALFLYGKISVIEAKSLKDDVYADLNKIFKMSSKKAIMPIIRYKNSISSNIIDLINKTNNNYNKAFILFLNSDIKEFDEFYLISQTENCSKRWCDARNDYSSCNIDINEEKINQLAKEIESYLKREDRAQQSCVETIDIGNIKYVLIFFEDFPQEEREIVENKKLKIVF
ncbi:MAG: hypothetical protein PHY80_06350 [Rickettsiales bacterium]|nr:hypothetical protein [Rickettsiales bacterium]